jgi:hypothetical protein
MRRIYKIRPVPVLPALLFVMLLLSASAHAQDASPDVVPDDQNQVPLGDVARNLRKTNPQPQQVIDDDNLSQVIAHDELQHKSTPGLRYVMEGGDKDFHMSAPDVTCSLAFTANARSLLSSQYAQMELPPADLPKLHGPATIEGDALTVSLFNGTDWHVSEISVAVTVVQKPTQASGGPFAGAASQIETSPEALVRPEKNPDSTFIFRMRAAAGPWATTVFNAPLNGDLAPGQEWHWAIVQARGYPPQTDVASAQPPAAHNFSSKDPLAGGPGVQPLSSSSPASLPQNQQ